MTPQSRIVGTALLLLTLMAGAANTAWAYWTSTGNGTGLAATATLNPPTAVTASNTPGEADVDVAWTAPTGLAPEGYYVTRIDDSDYSVAPACGSSPAALLTAVSCTDLLVPSGDYHYTVTAVYRSWTAVSSDSNSVSVGSDTTAPTLAVTMVNGSVETFPFATRAFIRSIGGTCGTAPGDLPTVSPLIDGVATDPATTSCDAGSWTLTFATRLPRPGTWIVSATQDDAAGNTGTAPVQTISSERIRPTLDSIARAGASESTNAGSLSWTVTFSEPVLGVATSDFGLPTSGIVGTPTVSSAAPVGGAPSATWIVSADMSGVTGTNTGSIGLDLTGRGSIADPATNTLQTTSFTGETYVYDTTPPAVTSIARAGASQVVNSGPLSWTVTFSEPVGGVDASSFGLAGTGITGTPTITAVTATGGAPSATWTVTTATTGVTGTNVAAIGLNLVAAGSSTDAATNPVSPASFTGQAYTYDTTAPDVTITRVNGLTRVFPYSTNSNVTSIGGACGQSAADSPTVTPLVDGAPTTPATATCTSGSWTLNLASPLSSDGARSLSATQDDAAGNTGTAPSQTITIDKTRPTVASIVRAGAAQAVKSGPLTWTVTFSEPVRGVAVSNFVLATNGIGGTAPAIALPTATGGSPSATWTVTTGATGTTGTNAGQIGLNVSSSGSVVDLVGNTMSTSSFTGEAYSYDTTRPTVSSIVRAGAEQAVNGGSMSWNVTFSEPVTGVAASNFGLALSGVTGTPTIATPAASGGSPSATWTVTANSNGATGTNTGSIGLNLTGSGSIMDAVGNTLSTTSSTGQAYTYDTTRPTVTGVSSTLANGSYRAGQVVPITVTFNEPVTVTGTPRLTLSTGTPSTTAVDYSGASGPSTLTFTYTVAAGNTSGDLDYLSTTALSGGTITDAATNTATLTLAAPGSAGSLGANKALVIDTTPPVVSVTRVNGSVQVFPLATNATVTSIGGACGTAPGDTGTVSPRINGAASNPATATCTSGSWTLSLTTALSTDGIRTLSATQVDAAGNTGTAPDQTLTIDRTRPTVSSIVRAGAAQSVNSGPLSWTVTFSEPVSAVATSNFALARSGITGTTSITGAVPVGALPSATWTVTASTGTATGTNAGSIGLNLTSSGSVVDQVGNTLSTTSFTGQTYTYDTTAATVTGVSSPLANGSYTVGQVVPVDVTFSEPVTVTGTPQLRLSTGAPVSTLVDYSSGSGTNVLTFDYVVAPGNTSADLDYASTAALVLNNNAAITDAATNPATLTLAAPGANGSLGRAKALVIDTTGPVVTVTGLQRLNFWFFNLVRVTGTADNAEGPVTVYLCTNVGAPCNAGNATQTVTNVTVSGGTWDTGWVNATGSGTWYAIATQTDSLGNVGQSDAFGPVVD